MADRPNNLETHEGDKPPAPPTLRSRFDSPIASRSGRPCALPFHPLANIAEYSSDFIGIFALDGRQISLNSAGRLLVGLAAGDIEARNLADFVADDDRDLLMAQVLPRAVSEGQQVVEVRFRHFAAVAETWVEFALFAARNTNAEPVTVLIAIARDITARKRREVAWRSYDGQREQLLEEQRNLAEREALLNHIGTVVRDSLDPEAILLAAVSALGEGLHADRCYFVRYDQVQNTGRVFPEWIRPGTGLHPLAGRTRPMSRYAVNRDPDFRQGRTHVAADTTALTPEDAAPLLALNVRSLLRVPITYGDQMTALGIAMGFQSRVWSEDEIRLVENATALVRAALESAHLQQRERNIARQLQEALLPPAPRGLPGLDLASFYRVALDEAGVGGDFFDVYTVAPGRTAIVVADLRGKGLQAASQVAMLRNMLRYALYTGTALEDAIGTLNRTLFEHGLIQGFATVFAGIYDDTKRTLTYINGGQEPGLLRRGRSGEFEQLESSGPVVGCFSGAHFEEQTVTLESGDILALFTDGLTEVGPDRRNLLGVDGVQRLVAEAAADPTTAGDPRAIVDLLIAGVDFHAQRGARDDIALLIGVAAP